jgi:hypothetical protein
MIEATPVARVAGTQEVIVSRRYQEQVQVRLGAPGEHGVRLDPGWCRGVGAGPGQGKGQVEVPTLFLWRGRLHLVQAVVAQWTQRVPWWRADHAIGVGGGELEHQVWRVEAGPGRSTGAGVYDLVHGGQWWLERVSD